MKPQKGGCLERVRDVLGYFAARFEVINYQCPSTLLLNKAGNFLPKNVWPRKPEKQWDDFKPWSILNRVP